MTARLGLDIGGTKIHAVVLDGDHQVLGQAHLPTTRGAGGLVTGAAEAARSAAQAAQVPWPDVQVVGVGVPGAVDHRTGVIRHAVNLGVEHLPLAAELSAALDGTPVHVENDVNAAALGIAATSSPAQATDSLAFLNLGTGLAAGLVMAGSLWRGSTGSAGEIGHLPLAALAGPGGLSGPGGVGTAGVTCACGLVDCLETMAAGAGIAAQWRAERGETPLRIKDVPTLAETDPVAAAIWRRLHVAVAAAVRVLVLTVDVQHVALGGGVAKLGDPLLAGVVSVLREWEAASSLLATLAPSNRVRIERAARPVAAIGAALCGVLPSR